MRRSVSRRHFLAGAAAGVGGLMVAPKVFAQSSGLLEKLRAAQTIKIAIPDNPPYSFITASGEVDGLAPSLIKTVMAKLGVPKVEGIIAPYGQVIPGLQAGRWDIIGACLSMSKQRCEQVLYADPVIREGGVFIYIPADVPEPPKSVADLSKMGLTVTMAKGSYVLQKCLDAGVPSDKILQVPELTAEVDAIKAKRAQIAYTTYYGALAKKAADPSLELVYPLPDDAPRGSSIAFRTADADLHKAFQDEFRAMKKSGEFTALAEKFGLAPTEGMLDITAEKECAAAA